MKIRIEIDPECDDEVIIRCRKADETAARLEMLIENELRSASEISLTSCGREYFMPFERILFFETCGDRTAAHTAPDGMYYSTLRLYELERLMPYTFVRVSKSCIVNSAEVESITRNIAGPSEITFRKSPKKAYASRMYYKDLAERIRETRLTPRVMVNNGQGDT